MLDFWGRLVKLVFPGIHSSLKQGIGENNPVIRKFGCQIPLTEDALHAYTQDLQKDVLLEC